MPDDLLSKLFSFVLSSSLGIGLRSIPSSILCTCSVTTALFPIDLFSRGDWFARTQQKHSPFPHLKSTSREPAYPPKELLKMQTSHLTKLLLLSLLHLHALAAFAVPFGFSSFSSLLSPRQLPAPFGNSSADGACQNYATIANLSTIGANSSYRAAFLQNSPQGTYASAAILNNAIAQIPLLTKDVNLNTQCGNLTTVAATEAANNFTRGVVAQFSGLPPPVKGFPNAMVILFLGIIFVVFMGVLFMSL